MKRTTHIRALTKGRPAVAELTPIWELIYITEALLRVFGTALGLLQSALQLFKGSP